MPETHSLIQPKEPLKAILEECEAMVKTYMESELGMSRKTQDTQPVRPGLEGSRKFRNGYSLSLLYQHRVESTNFLVNDRNVDGRRINENSVGEKTGDCIKDNEKKHIW